MNHGTITAYVHHRCRCERCKQANTEYRRKQKVKRYAIVAEGGGLPDHVPHGHSAYTNWGCRCETCTKAFSAYNAPYVEAYWRRKLGLS